jgi:F0F1-type ATP synthase alpha subunit
VGKVGEFERRALSEIKVREPGILAAIRDTGEMKGDVEKQLVAFLDAFSKSFQ